MSFLDFAASPILGIFKTIGGGVLGYFKEKQKIKAKRQERIDRIDEAKTVAHENRLTKAQDGDIAWENTSIENAGWKDEWILVLFSVPIVMCFAGPGGAAWVTAGFAALATTPLWFQSAWGVMVASAFGYKKFANLMMLKKGGTPNG